MPAKPQQRIAAIVLAAGSSSRLGQPKQLLKHHGESLLARTVRSAVETGANPVLVVLGANSELIHKHLDEKPTKNTVRYIYNSDWESGMGSSIAAGISALDACDIEAAFVLVCDQPALNSGLLKQMLTSGAALGESIVQCQYEKGFGPPVLFGRVFFKQLRELNGRSGARTVIKHNLDKTHTVPFPEGKIDIDTINDLKHLISVD